MIKKKNSKPIEEDWQPEFDDDRDDDYDNGYSPSEQRAADLSDYAGDLLRAGKICPEQAAEIRAGA